MKQLYFLSLLLSFSLFAQNRKGEFRLTSTNGSHELYTAFLPHINLASEDYSSELAKQIPEIQALITEYQIEFEKGIQISNEKIDFLAAEALRISKTDASVKKLKNILKLKINNPSNERLYELAGKLENLKEVEYTSLMALTPIAPPSDIPPTTSNYVPLQTYMGPNPGVNMDYAHGLGLTGNGIRVRDVEYGFNRNHEDLNEVNISVAQGMNISIDATTTYTEHGTPVFGIIMAHKGTYGITGMAHTAQEMVLFPEWQNEGYDRVNAVSQAVANSQLGDVIIYEMQAYGQNNNYAPAEFDSPIWDLTKAATDAGIIIVEAAANGNQNLDSAYYSTYMGRGNSGAIMVGGGRSNLSHQRISYSNYGARVDVQGWSENVYACGYGDIIQVGGDFNQGYTYFSGTSSATPVVAGCVVVLQSYHRAQTGTYMTPSQMNQLLKNTGTPQGSGGHIGPLPNMQAAIERINQTLSVTDESQLLFSILPNPAEDRISIVLPYLLSEDNSIEIYDNVGRKVTYRSNISKETEISVSNFPKGIYFVKVISGNKAITKKLLKK